MNNEILPMLVAFVRVLRQQYHGLPRIPHIPAFLVSIVHKTVIGNSVAVLRASPAAFLTPCVYDENVDRF